MVETLINLLELMKFMMQFVIVLEIVEIMIITFSMITIFNLDNDGLDSGIYHSFNAVYYK